eukprot:scaffold1016_cov105-Cylindrotheca_fusiformis.AAC.1
MERRTMVFFFERGGDSDYVPRRGSNGQSVEIDPVTPAEVPRPCDLECIRLQDYDPQESESPCQAI